MVKKDNLTELAFSFHHMGPEGLTQVVLLDSLYTYVLSNVSSPRKSFDLNTHYDYLWAPGEPYGLPHL